MSIVARDRTRAYNLHDPVRIQYDHPPDAARRITKLTSTHARAVAMSRNARSSCSTASSRATGEVQELAPLVNTSPRPAPRCARCTSSLDTTAERRVSLPRAIPFCASLYSIGVPPELIGSARSPTRTVLLRRDGPSIEQSRGRREIFGPRCDRRLLRSCAKACTAACR